MPRKSSAVWKFFLRTDEKRAVCTICNKSCSTSGNTTNVTNHLKSKHSEAYESLTNSLNDPLNCSNLEKSVWDENETVVETTEMPKIKKEVKKRKRKSIVLEPLTNDVTKEDSFNFFNNSFNNHDLESELDIFGSSIAAQLKRLPEKKAVRLTLQINNLIGKARLEDIEEQNRSNSGDHHPQIITVSYDKPDSNLELPYLKQEKVIHALHHSTERF